MGSSKYNIDSKVLDCEHGSPNQFCGLIYLYVQDSLKCFFVLYSLEIIVSFLKKISTWEGGGGGNGNLEITFFHSLRNPNFPMMGHFRCGLK